jgi:hypothetical protein
MKLASFGSVRCAGARHQKFLRRKRNAMGVGVIQQSAMMGLWNEATAPAPGFFMLPPIRR